MPTSHLTASVRTVRAIVEASEAIGGDKWLLLEAVGIDPVSLDDVDARVPFSKLSAIYEAGERLTRDRSFGLHVAQHIPKGGFGVLEYVLLSCPDLGTSFERICRYFSLLVDGVDVRFEVEGDVARFSHRFPPSAPPIPRHSQEFVMACALVYGRQASGIDWIPERVTFPHDAPEDTSSHRELFGRLPEFGCPAAEIIFDSELLEVPVVTADPGLLVILERHAQALLEKLPDEESTANRVRILMSERLRGAAPTLEEVAGEIGMSARTLQRRLKEEGTSHQSLLDEIRHELALRYLDDDTITISEVAFILGFSEPSAFHRAFRRWTDLTPKEYRKRAA